MDLNGRRLALFFAGAVLLAGCSGNGAIGLSGSNIHGGMSGFPTRHASAPQPDLSGPNFTQFLLTNQTAAEPASTALGSDNRIWVVQDNGPLGGTASIDAIGVSGSVTQYNLSGPTALQITSGQAGTLWFTERSTNIGTITTSGQITLFPFPAGQSPSGIAYGPDGNVWYLDVAGNSLVKFNTMKHSFASYSIPTANSNPDHIIVAPDQHLWFTETAVGNIAKADTTGAITEFPLRGGVGAPFNLVSGYGNDLYVQMANGVERVTTSGAVVQTYADSSVYGLSSISVGDGGTLWVTGTQSFGVPPSTLQLLNLKTGQYTKPANVPNHVYAYSTIRGADGDVWISAGNPNVMDRYEENLPTIGIRLNGEMSIIDPNYGFELGYAVGTGTKTQTISLTAGESVRFTNLDTIPHSAAFLGNASPSPLTWPATFNGSTTQSPAGTAIGTTNWATGSLSAGQNSPIYETGLPGFYMIGCQYHYNTNEMRTVIVVH